MKISLRKTMFDFLKDLELPLRVETLIKDFRIECKRICLPTSNDDNPIIVETHSIQIKYLSGSNCQFIGWFQVIDFLF